MERALLRRRLVAAPLIPVLVAAASGCQAIAESVDSQVTSLERQGARFEISDAAVYSNCLTLAFAVRGFRPPPGLEPQEFFPPATRIDIEASTPDGPLEVLPTGGGGGGGGGGGDEADGRIWMEQRIEQTLAQPVPEGEEVTLVITATLDEDFASNEPLTYRLTVRTGPGGGSCPSS